MRDQKKEAQDHRAELAAVDSDTGPSTTGAASGYLACHVCGKPASCIGAYEGSRDYRPACDSCCGHGNEDGRCWPAAEAVTMLSDALKAEEDRADEVEGRLLDHSWQPIETAPKGKEVLVWKEGSQSHVVAIWTDRHGGWVTAWSFDPIDASAGFEPTHWMLLPAPPVVGCADQASQEHAAPLPSEAQK